MTEQQKNKGLFEALLKVAVSEAFETEMASLPADEELTGYEPSPALNRRIDGVIRKSYRRIKARRALKTVGKTAACLCVLLTVSSVVLLSVRATRNAIFNAVIEWREKYTQLQFEESPGQSEEPPAQDFRRPSYLPEGFTEISARFFEITAQLVYENSAGDKIILNEQKAGTGTTAIDNEHHDYSEIEINGGTAYLFTATEQDGANILIWEAHGIVYTLLSTVGTDELIRVGESLK